MRICDGTHVFKIPFHRHPFLYLPGHICTSERLSCEARVEKLTALNFRLVSPETWKSWRWVSGNQELPPDFHLQSWQKFQTLLKADSRERERYKIFQAHGNNSLLWLGPISACMTEQWNWYECREIYYYGQLLRKENSNFCKGQNHWQSNVLWGTFCCWDMRKGIA